MATEASSEPQTPVYPLTDAVQTQLNSLTPEHADPRAKPTSERSVKTDEPPGPGADSNAAAVGDPSTTRFGTAWNPVGETALPPGSHATHEETPNSAAREWASLAAELDELWETCNELDGKQRRLLERVAAFEEAHPVDARQLCGPVMPYLVDWWDEIEGRAKFRHSRARRRAAQARREVQLLDQKKETEELLEAARARLREVEQQACHDDSVDARINVERAQQNIRELEETLICQAEEHARILSDWPGVKGTKKKLLNQEKHRKEKGRSAYRNRKRRGKAPQPEEPPRP